MEGYWPGSPKQFYHVFSEYLFKLWDSAKKHMPGTSETAFLKSLGNLSSERGRVCKYENACLQIHVCGSEVRTDKSDSKATTKYWLLGLIFRLLCC